MGLMGKYTFCFSWVKIFLIWYFIGMDCNGRWVTFLEEWLVCEESDFLGFVHSYFYNICKAIAAMVIYQKWYSNDFLWSKRDFFIIHHYQLHPVNFYNLSFSNGSNLRTHQRFKGNRRYRFHASHGLICSSVHFHSNFILM